MLNLVTFLSLLLAVSAGVFREHGETDIKRITEVSNRIGEQLQHSLSSEPGNQLISPYGISSLLSALYIGTSGSTQEQLGSYGYRELEQEDIDISIGYQKLQRILEKGYTRYQIRDAKVVLFPEDYTLIPQYEKTLLNSYHALVGQVDYGYENIYKERVNDWVREQTRGKVSHITNGLDAYSNLALMNAISYQGKWQIQFDPQNIQIQPFYNEGKSIHPQPVITMQTQATYPYYKDQQLQAVEIPLQDGEVSMLMLLPTQKYGIRQLQQDVGYSTIKYIRSNSQEMQVKVVIPQFKLDYYQQLEPVFRSIGITYPFESNADLSGITQDETAYVSQFDHRAVVEIGEEEIIEELDNFNYINDEAAVQLKANRPFLFYIIHKNTGLILFIGRISQF